NSLSNKMDNSLLDVRDINHKYIVVGRLNLHKTNAANEELVSRLIYGRKAQGGIRYTDCSYILTA
ncbi:hypothetical protein HMPREF9469_04651, partial [, partial [[Clostridium] citroniae WAL-17108]